ncbi:MAG: hypothetical protein IJZ19_10635 [Lentisphaeria bacterium]|nr:hypothetical protein [Lentisphaeria bacterium]
MQATKQEISEKIKKIYRYRCWRSDKMKMQELEELVETIYSLDKDEGYRAKAILDQGAEIARLHNDAFHAGKKNNHSVLARIKDELKELGATEFEIEKADRQFQTGQGKVKMFEQDSSSLSQIKEQIEKKVPSYGKNTQHPFFIGNLKPEKYWAIYIDETGEIFDNTAFHSSVSSRKKGKLTALFVPSNSPLPQLPEHHATNKGSTENLKVLADLIQFGKNKCGLLGVNLDNMAVIDQNYYFTLFERLIDITLRLLKPNTDGTRLEFFVENRGEDTDKGIEKMRAMLQQTAAASLYHYAKCFPDQAEKFTIKVDCIAKGKTKDQKFITHNGYIDTVACAWNHGRVELYDVLEKGSFINRCLLEGDVQELPLVMDQLERGKSLPVKTWISLLSSPDAAAMDSPVKILLDKFGTLLRDDLRLWNVFVDETLAHLDSKAIDLPMLSKQINFLSVYIPASASLPPRLKMIWKTTQLAEKNHLGKTSKSDLTELNTLKDSLYIEDAPLCCWSTLHMAVEETNAFCFENAKKTVIDFMQRYGLFKEDLTCQELFPNGTALAPEWIPQAAIFGLRYYGQVFSTLGQHEAFSGNAEKAEDHFQKAIKCYNLLSDGGIIEKKQTMSYLVINRMDSIADIKQMSYLMEEYLEENLENAIPRLAISNLPAEKYSHAILLRYLVELDKAHPAVKAYLEFSDRWQTSDGHPWEIIEFYRAVLCEDEKLILLHLHKAYELAQKGGITLQVIAAVILGSIYLYDSSVKNEYEKLIKNIRNRLPSLGKRGEILEEQLHKKHSPLTFAKMVLPFNFR